MIDMYDHAVGLFAELGCGTLVPLHKAIPELAEMAPSEEWKQAGFAAARDAIVGESSENPTSEIKNR